MPISRSEFERDEIIDRFAILELFRTNRDLAYTLEDVIESLHSSGVNLSERQVEDILSSLERRGYLELKEVKGTRYYAYRRLGFERPRR